MGKWLLFVAAAVILAVWSGALDVRFDWRGPAATAIDLFGSDDEEKEKGGQQTAEVSAEPFWSESSPEEAPPPTPSRMPGSFAELAENASPAVVNIRTSKTV
jgi:S1-C subfamily serine protease